MNMFCTNCGNKIEPGSRFCMKCGAPVGVQQIGASSIPPNLSIPTNIQSDQPQPTATSSTVYQTVNTTQNPYTDSQVASTANADSINIWGPFAGYGTRTRHIGWLMDNKGDKSKELISKIDENFSERKIPGVSFTNETLTEKGVLVESRPYFMLKRKLISMALYVTDFGKDLYISLASYLKPPISNFKCIVLGAMVLMAFYTVFFYAKDLLNAYFEEGLFGLSTDSGTLVPLLCIIGPVGAINNLLLFIFFLFSTYKWLTEKDFWAGLRVPANEFNQDDLMAMEKAVEQTVRQSMDEIGLDSSAMKSINLNEHRQII